MSERCPYRSVPHPRHAISLAVALFHNLHHGLHAAVSAVVQRLAPAICHPALVRSKLDATPAPIAARSTVEATAFFFELAHHAVGDGCCFITIHGCPLRSWNRPEPV